MHAKSVFGVVFKKGIGPVGPWPAAFFVYGMLGAEPPQMEEQPEALAIIMRSPKSWVTSLAYGVSPQPAQAPENFKKRLFKLAAL